MSIVLSSDLDKASSIPYFLWDEPMTVEELKARLSSPTDEKYRLLGKIMREARDTDVWHFTTPREVVDNWNEIARYLGRRRDFWHFLITFWEKEGLIG